MKKIKIMIVCILTLLMLTSCTGQNIYPSGTPDTQQIIDEASDESNPYYDIIEPDIEWVKLSRSEKLNKAQQIIEIEKKNLGISDIIILIITNNGCDSFCLCSHKDYHILHINTEYFSSKSSSEVIEIICKEVYHIYQKKLIQEYLNSDVRNRNLICYNKARVYLREMFRATDETTNKSVSEFDRESYHKMRYVELYRYFLIHRKGDGLMSDKV